MKTSFSAYLRPSEVEFKDLWANCFFTFDTNILLNLYRFKDETKDEFIKIFKHDKISSRIFITYNVGLEYIKNRPSEISNQAEAYTNFINDIEKIILSPLLNKSRHPHISEQLSSELQEIINKVKDEAKVMSNEITAKHTDDTILNTILELFDSKISAPFIDKEVQELCKEGENRYAKKIPPGYKDKGKGELDQYGDFLIWKQIIAYIKSLEEKKDLIIVTDDTKEDWWLNHKGMKSPHPLLIDEFSKETGKRLYLYTSDMFYQYASELINETVNQDVIDNVVEVRDELSSSRDMMLKTYINNYSHNFEIITEDELMDKLKFFRDNIAKGGGYIGLKKFVTEFLANQDYEINHTYAIINNLVEKQLISISTQFDDSLNYNVKVVEIIDSIPRADQS